MNQNLGGSKQKFRCRGACFQLFKFHLLNGPIQSQYVIQMHLKNMLFGSVNTMQNAQFTSHSRLYLGECSLPKEGTDLTTWKSEPLMSAEPTQEQLCGGGYSPHGDECCECYESDDSDSECSCDSEGCCEDEDDSDSDDGDDLVEFSDETHASEVECESANLSKCETFMSLSSIESGYFETRSDSVCSSDELSESEDEDESDHKRAEEDEVVWRCFEEQALSPVLSHRSQQNCSHSKLNPTELAVETTSSHTGEKCYTRDIKCHPPSSYATCVQSRSEQCTGEMCLLETSSSGTSTCINPLYNGGEKHVSFKPDCELVVVHNMVAWDFAYRAARKGPWEEYARNRQHFRRRIDTLSSILTPCLIKKLKACSSAS